MVIVNLFLEIDYTTTIRPVSLLPFLHVNCYQLLKHCLQSVYKHREEQVRCGSITVFIRVLLQWLMALQETLQSTLQPPQVGPAWREERNTWPTLTK